NDFATLCRDLCVVTTFEGNRLGAGSGQGPWRDSLSRARRRHVLSRDLEVLHLELVDPQVLDARAVDRQPADGESSYREGADRERAKRKGAEARRADGNRRRGCAMTCDLAAEPARRALEGVCGVAHVPDRPLNKAGRIVEKRVVMLHLR